MAAASSSSAAQPAVRSGYISSVAQPAGSLGLPSKVKVDATDVLYRAGFYNVGLQSQDKSERIKDLAVEVERILSTHTLDSLSLVEVFRIDDGLNVERGILGELLQYLNRRAAQPAWAGLADAHYIFIYSLASSFRVSSHALLSCGIPTQPYRQALHVVLQHLDTGAKIFLYINHSPSSQSRSLKLPKKRTVLRTLLAHARSTSGAEQPAIVLGGDYNCTEMDITNSLDRLSEDGFRVSMPYLCTSRPIHRHGDLAMLWNCVAMQENSRFGKSFKGFSDSHDVVLVPFFVRANPIAAKPSQPLPSSAEGGVPGSSAEQPGPETLQPSAVASTAERSAEQPASPLQPIEAHGTVGDDAASDDWKLLSPVISAEQPASTHMLEAVENVDEWDRLSQGAEDLEDEDPELLRALDALVKQCLQEGGKVIRTVHHPEHGVQMLAEPLLSTPRDKWNHLLSVTELQHDRQIERTRLVSGRAAQSAPRSLTNAEMASVMKHWKEEYHTWLNDLDAYEKVVQERPAQEAHQYLRKRFNVYKFSLFGSRPLVSMLIQFPFRSAAQPAAWLRRFLEHWLEVDSSSEAKKLREESIEKNEEEKELKNIAKQKRAYHASAEQIYQKIQKDWNAWDQLSDRDRKAYKDFEEGKSKRDMEAAAELVPKTEKTPCHGALMAAKMRDL